MLSPPLVPFPATLFSITTFVDQRYGTGDYLLNLGFSFKGMHTSFRWTDCKNTFHRMNFRGNSGYNKGLHKIWDCGQSKWVNNSI